MIIEQFLPAFHYGDAIGNSTLRFHEYLLSRGIESNIIALTIDENLKGKAVSFKDYKNNPESLKILHFAIPSELTDYFLNISGKKAMVYHNITPPHFFIDYSDELVKITREGRNQLKRLSKCFDVIIADSQYNADELKEYQFNNIFVFPIMINLDDFSKPHSKAFYDLFKDDRKNIIFVGRISPNKKIEHLIRMLFFYKKYISPSIRLVIAGKTDTLPKYFCSLMDLASRFLLTSEDIIFTGHIPQKELLAIYKLGDVFISLSEHEGFCLPLIESCFFEVPVIAYDAGAVSETLAGSGIIVKEFKYDYIAGLSERVLYDPELNSRLKELEKKRIEKYIIESDPEKLLSILKKI
ncbi:MAG: glycosyltransferase family 4 protein [Candidatus Aminicenantes bacterium]|nr:glycosyltransferase family 4 protein [Candidatus Aminicenantes bacterium]